MNACECNVGLGNTGLPNCQNIMTVARKLILVPYEDNAGARNGITLSDTLDQTYFDGKVNDSDSSQRWFPLPLLDNVTNERGEPVTETSDIGTIAHIKDGIRAFFGEMWNQSPQLVDKINTARCVEVGAYVVDFMGRIIGSISDDGATLYPIRIDRQSLNAIFAWPTGTTTAKVNLGFNWHQNETDGKLRVIEPSEYTGDVLSLNGLLDIYAEFSGLSTTGGTVRLYTIFGTAKAPLADSGLLLADSVLFNVTDSLAVTKLTWVESPDGTYAYTHAAQTSADVMRLTPTKAGRDYAAVVAETYLIP